MRRTADSSAKTSRKRKQRRQLRRHSCLLWNFPLHALGEPENAQITQNAVGAQRFRRRKTRSLCLRARHATNSRNQNLAVGRFARIRQISLWIVLVVAFIGGLFSGFLGGGAGYIRMPSMVYVLGIPTHLAVGTDLFEIVISASYGTFTHAIKGNVDI